MQQISISDIQRNLHKLDNFDIVEIIDKKRNQVKGYFIDNKYAGFVQELFENQFKTESQENSIGGSLHKYANPSLIKDEDKAWKEHIEEKHKI
jgi:DNA-binding transcriptional regulator GbsR (MarR family)